MSTSSLVIQREHASWLSRVADFVELSKPRISMLVLVVVAVSYHLARWGQPQPWIMLHVLLGTLLVAASASAMNQWLERHTDALMERTADRPVPSGRLGRRETIGFAVATVTIGVGYLIATVGWQPALWAGVTWLLYVGVYTPLKARSWLNTAVGAVAGAVPVLIGWSAAGSYDLRAGGFFVLVFLWQFPHFMAIAWLYRRQYGRAGLQMLPVVEPSGRRAGVQAVLGALALIPVSLVPAMDFPSSGLLIYSLAAVLLGLGQLSFAWQFFWNRDECSARGLLRASLVYLPALLLLMLWMPWW